MNQRVNLDQVKDKVKSYLVPYLERNGFKMSGKNTFKCPNPDHQDVNPSCGIVPGTDDKVFHCFSCHAAGDIFLAAQFIDQRPMSGRGFISDNLMYLAEMFGVDIPDMELTDDELYEIETYRAYHSASVILKTSDMSEVVKSRLVDLGWPKEVLSKIGIGSVTSFKDYIHRMLTQYGFKQEFLEEIDLANKLLFHENNLIFTIKDEHGSPVGFAARDLKYDKKKQDYDDEVEGIKSKKYDLEEEGHHLAKLFKPSKFINTSTKCKIYQKSKRLFNVNMAKKYTPPLFIFEGYSDVVTAVAAGLKNSCSIGSTAFSKDHLDLILALDVKHLVFVLDADKAGVDGTERFVRLLEEHVGGHVGLRVEIIVMPEGSDDPDSFIRKMGLDKGRQAFLALERLDIFSWRLKKGLQEGEDALSLAEKAIPLIVNEQNYLLRMQMKDRLAAITGLDKEGLWREVMRRVDADMMRTDEEKTIIAKRVASELLRNSKDIGAVLESGRAAVEQIEKQRTGYDQQNVVRSVEYVLDRQHNSTKRVELITGYPMLDKALGGIPREEAFISSPGKPNQGKSTLYDNLTYKLLENNSDVIVMFHSVDDALSARIPRMLGAKFKVKSEYFKRAGYYLQRQNIPPSCPDFEDIYHEAQKWLRKQISEERLILADVAGLVPSLPAHELWVKSIRQKYPNMALVCLCDNFHLYNLPGYEPGENKIREMSMFIKRAANQHKTTMMFTTELPKGALAPGVRPRIANIKGSSGLAYDANANLGVYNDLKDKGEKATLFWEDTCEMEPSIGPNGEQYMRCKRKPIIELVIDKSKLSSFDGSIFFRLDPETANMEECSEAEQLEMRKRVSDSLNVREQYAQGNHAFTSSI